MKLKRFLFRSLLLVFPALFMAGCGGKKTEATSGKSITNPVEAPAELTENELLLKELEKNGDYVNSQNFPSLIKASIVFEELGSNNLVIDLRDKQAFAGGHIKGSVNVGFRDLPDYFESGIKPFEYDKIILVCDDGQESSYTASLLRLMGYANVYAMRWGLSGWNRKYAEKAWLKGVSGKYEDMLELKTNDTPVPGKMPDLKTGTNNGQEILETRLRSVFAAGDEDVLISADEVFNDPFKYFIVNFERKDKYEDGHIPGAVRYKPESTLGLPDVMSTIPDDKTVVVYCGTGHNSGFATAFLRLCGYDARTLRYGNNSFMYDKMIKEKSALSWLPFTSAESNDFPLVR